VKKPVSNFAFQIQPAALHSGAGLSSENQAAAAAAAAANAAASMMEPVGDIAIGVAVGEAFLDFRAGALNGVDGEARDAAARLCDLAVEAKGGIRADPSAGPPL
jgi:hypothetical protein